MAKKNLKFTIEKNHVFRNTPEKNLTMDIYNPVSDGKRPAVLVLHGGGWIARSGDMESICRDLASQGFVVFNGTYRLAPKSKFPAPVEDAKAGIKWIRDNAKTYNVDPEQLFGWGYSAGANMILLAALDGSMGLKAIVTGGTPADLTVWPKSPLVKDFIGTQFKDDQKTWEAASPINHVTDKSPPLFLYHGEWDVVVEIGQMKKLQEAMEKAKRVVQVHPVRFGGHASVYLFSQDSVNRGIQFFEKYLKP